MSSDSVEPLKRQNARLLLDLVDDDERPRIYTSPAGKAPVGMQPLQDWEEEDEDFDEACVEALEDAEVMEAHREYQDGFRKRLHCEEEYEPEVCDLSTYFGGFGLTEYQQISMCRTYANYLTQKMKARLPQSLKKIKKVSSKK